MSIAIFAIFAILASIAGITLFVMWIIGFVDLLKRKDIPDNEKILWGLGMFFINGIVPTVYFFLKDRKNYGIINLSAIIVTILSVVASLLYFTVTSSTVTY